jgi:plastocyanin
MKRTLSVALAFAAFAALACGGDSEPTNGGQPGVPANLVISSGDGQKVATSSEIIAPFVAKVTDGLGNGVRNIEVTWEVTSGGGSLSATSIVTDLYGEAEVYLTAGSAEGENTATATVEGLSGSPVTFTVNAVEPASIAMVSGNNQMGRTGQPLAEPMVVQVMGTDGLALPGARIGWAPTQGPGALNPAESATDTQGKASSVLILGSFAVPYAVTASVKTKTSLSVSFSATGTPPQTVVVEIQNNEFNAPGGGDAVTILLGDAVQWLNRDTDPHTATSDSEPEGGSAFDSGDIIQNGTFTFTANVRGRWTYHCRYHEVSMAGAQINVE